MIFVGILVLSVLLKCLVDIFILKRCHTRFSNTVVNVKPVLDKRQIIKNNMDNNKKSQFRISHGKLFI